MRLRDLYKGPQPDISIELFPPKTPEGITKLFEKVEHLKEVHPAFFSMTYGAGGGSREMTLDLVDRLKNKTGVETMCHLTCIGHSRSEIEKTLEHLKKMGVYNIIALRGDAPREVSTAGKKQDFEYAVDLVRTILKHTFFSVAVAGFPEKHPDAKDLKTDLMHLKEKVDAGADVIITQLFFDNDFFFRYVDAARREGIRVPIIPGILPILSVAQVRRFTTLCQASIPEKVARELAKYEKDDIAAQAFGIELAAQQCQDLLRAGAQGLHFYALNQSRSVEAVLGQLKIV